jgi:hypothetical protein
MHAPGNGANHLETRPPGSLLTPARSIMAKGKTCPSCKTPMYALKEEEQPKGTWVTYECTNGNCKNKVKVFESK